MGNKSETLNLQWKRNMRFFKRNVGGILLLVVCVLSSLQHISAVASPFFQTLDITNGLSHNMIYSIYKDERGFIWLGTQMGLDRFDGIQVKSYPQFNGRSVFAICETDSVNLWIGTDAGLKRLDRSTDEVEDVMLDKQAPTVKFIYDAGEEGLLIGTVRGLYVRQVETMTEPAVIKVLPDKNVLSQTNILSGICKDEKGGYWFTTSGGIIRYDAAMRSSQIHRYPGEDDALNRFTCIVCMQGILYIGSSNRGLFRFDPMTKVFTRLPDIGNGYIKTLSPADDGSLYVGTNGGGVKRVSILTGEILSTLEHSDTYGSISSNAIYSFLRDEDVFWIGTYLGGLNYTPSRGNSFSVYAFDDMYNSFNQNIRSFWIGEDGRKILGTRDGLVYIEEKKKLVKQFSSRNSLLRSNIILCVYPLKEDFLIGTYGGGLYLLDHRTWELSGFGSGDAFRKGSYSSFTEDKRGKLWMATSEGVYEYDERTGDYNLYDRVTSSLPDNSTFSIYCDSKDRIWAGTASGIALMDADRKRFITDILPEGLRAFMKSPRHIYEDRRGNIWLCDDKEGVIRINERFDSFEHYTAADFLPNNSIMSITEDEGGLWFSSQKGLMYYGNDGSTQFFSLYDGIPGYIFNYPVQKTADSTIWWANERGLVYYNPSAHAPKHPAKPLKPVLTSLSVSGKELVPGDKILRLTPEFTRRLVLPSDEGNIEFAFSALNYALPNANIYEYKLDGHDSSWQRLVGENRVSYNNLPVGEYTFRVRHASAAGTEEQIGVKVAYRLPLSVWITLLSIVGCGVLFYFYSRLLARYRQVKLSLQPKEPEIPRGKYGKSKMEESEMEEIKKRLLKQMDHGKPYLNPDLKLPELAESISCQPAEISQVLNRYLQTNFSDFINQYRIEEFIARVQDPTASRYTLTSLSELCGFSSRTSFFRSFKKIKGKTPAEYIKEMNVVLKK